MLFGSEEGSPRPDYLSDNKYRHTIIYSGPEKHENMKKRSIAIFLIAVMSLSILAIGGAMAGVVVDDPSMTDEDGEAVDAFNASADVNTTTEYWLATNLEMDEHLVDDMDSLTLEVVHDNNTHFTYEVESFDEDDFGVEERTVELEGVEYTDEDTEIIPGLVVNLEDGEDHDVTIESTVVDDEDHTETLSEDDEESTEFSIDGLSIDVEVTDDGEDGADPVDLSFTFDATTYEFVFSNDELETLPGEPGDNTTVTMEISENVSDQATAAVNSSSTDIEHDYEFGDERNVMYLADGDDDASVTLDERSPAFWQVFTDDLTDHWTLDADRSIEGDNTTVYAYMADDNMSADWDETIEGQDDGTFALTVAGAADDTPTFVFMNEVDDDLVDEDEDTYFVYHEDDNMLALHLGEEYEDEDSVEVFALNTDPVDAFGFFAARGEF